MKRILLMAVVVSALTSCYNTRVIVGNVNTEAPLEAVNTQWCDHFLFGLIPMETTKIKPGEFVSSGNYVIRTHKTFLNGLVSTITCGIYTPTQTTFYLPSGSSAVKGMQEKNSKKLKTVFFK